MQPIQIKTIENGHITVYFTGEKARLPKEVEHRISEYWQWLVDTKPHLRNGEVFTVTKTEDKADGLRVELAETNYAHYMYSHQARDLGDHTVQIIHSAVLVSLRITS